MQLHFHFTEGSDISEAQPAAALTLGAHSAGAHIGSASQLPPACLPSKTSLLTRNMSKLEVKSNTIYPNTA